MTSIKKETTPSTSLECCMCGDSGLTHELFQCSICQFRSQHRYCSNLYPKAKTYEVCNWCLNQKEDSKEKSQNSCNSSATNEDYSIKNNKNKKATSDHTHNNGLKVSQRNNLKLQMIKKPKSPEKSPATSPTPMTPTRRKRIITNARLEEKLIRRTKSEEMSNKGSITTRHVYRNKVRRYKLLDEVSSQIKLN